MTPAEYILHLVQSGFGNLAAYLAAHVLLCLLPAFFIAGAMTALIPKESVTRFLGRNTPKFISYPAAAMAGMVLAVCSCTIVPLFAGIYKKGAGIGPAITFLFFAPAANILALSYTGSVLGMDLAIARFILSLSFGIGIGLIMALIFHKEDQQHDEATDALFAGQSAKGMAKGALFLLIVLVVLLLAGTFQIALLTQSYGQFTLPSDGAFGLQQTLNQLVPFDASRGEEGLTVQGLTLIGLLAAIGLTMWKGIEHIHEGFSRWTWASLGVMALTLLFASLRIEAVETGLLVKFPGKFFAVLAALGLIGALIAKKLDREELQDWLWETWRFIKQIFPLLIVGVFIVGMLRVIIQPEWIEALAGSNTVLGNFAGVVFGVFMYFPTLVEVPIANMFLSLGMHRGPLLAYLMADPELSLQSIIMVSAIIGRLKAWTYVGWVALFSTLAGLLYGAWINGTSLGLVALYLVAFLALLAGALWLINRRKEQKEILTA